MITLDTPLEKLSHVGPAYIKRLHKLGLRSVRDLVFYWPHRHEDFSEMTPISQAPLKINEKTTIRGKIADIQNIRTWKKRMKITEAFVEDETGTIKVVWFNQPFLTNSLKRGLDVSLSGKITMAPDGPVMSNPVYELLKFSDNQDTKHTGRLIPVYRETHGLSSRYLRFLIWPLLPLTDSLPEFLPAAILKNQNLMGFREAVKQIHFPHSHQAVAEAKKRLAFNELFILQLFVLKQKHDFRSEQAPAVKFNQDLVKKFVDSLPFKLTASQRIAAWEILQDIQKSSPMNRLLDGDVGSGKTVVAVIAALETAANGFQAALMAPTEVLSRQHFETAAKLLKGRDLKIGLLTGSEAKIFSKNKPAEITKKEFMKEAGDGKINFVIGTHALIQKEIVFKNLALAIIDEQHRFGVSQRATLQKPRTAAEIQKNKDKSLKDGLKQTIPHLLSMTATPIPRTLALTIFGDLEISLLKEMPRNRQKIITEIVAPPSRRETYEFIRREIKNGRQAFVICPRIEIRDDNHDNDNNGDGYNDNNNKNRNRNVKGQMSIVKNSLWDDVKAVTEEYEKLSREIFPELKIGMLHGKLKPKEKEAIMKDFGANKTQILVSTSVVEVGVDVPNATVMMIEGAEKFGLAQLHQFRGRVGRGEFQSYCFLLSDSTAKTTNQRLKALISAKNGFELAEKDLAIRGPGDFCGVRQWGIPDLAMASLSDLETIKKAREEADKILSADPALKNHSLLLEKLRQFKTSIHFE